MRGGVRSDNAERPREKRPAAAELENAEAKTAKIKLRRVADGSGSSRGNPVKHGRGFRRGDLDRRESVGKILRQKLKSHKPETKSSLSGTRTQGRKS
jgi:hypothetical protein